MEKNRIRIGKKQIVTVLALLLCTVFLSPSVAKAAETVLNPDATKTGYHLEVKGEKTGTLKPEEAVDISCSWSGLNPTVQELKDKNNIINETKMEISTRVEDYTAGGINDTVTHKRLVLVLDDGREYILSSPYVDANNGWAGYAYYILHFGYAKDIDKWFLVGSAHYWLGTTNGDSGYPEVHDAAYSYSYTLYQFVANDYTVKYDGNGEDSGSVTKQSCTYDESFTTRANKFVRAGYTFAGWNTKANGSGTSYDASKSVKNLTTNDNGTVTLYAQWEINAGTITYHANGGTITDAPHQSGSKYYKLASSIVQSSTSENGTYETTTKTVKYTSSASDLISPKTPNLSKTGYHIETGKEWNTKTDGSGTTFDQAVDYDPTEYFSTLATKTDLSMVLYANWKINTYTIAYNGNGATAGSVASQTATYNTAITISNNAFVKSGYEFTGWNTKADGSGTSYSAAQSVKNLTTANAATVTLYAQWKAKNYTIHFDGNGATAGSMKDLAATVGIGTQLPANGFTRTTDQGQSGFKGWNTNKDAVSADYLDQTSITDLTNQPETTVTLYAIWDDCPQITASDRYFTLAYAVAGKITEAELLNTATGTDKEDVTLENRTADQAKQKGIAGSLTISDYQSGSFTSLTGDAEVIITYLATDSYGNTYSEPVTVHIYSTEAKTVEEKTIRSIDWKYFNKSYEEGGLSPDSIWTTDPEYHEELKKALLNQENDTPEQTYQFSHEDILEMKEYIDRNGYENFDQENVWKGFYNQFLAVRE